MGRIGDRLRRRYDNLNRTRRLDNAASKDDIKRLRRDLDNNLRRAGEPSGAQLTGRAIKMVGRGFADIGRSLNRPYDTRRPKISQMPQRRRDIGISSGTNLDFLKHPSLRGKDLRGRRFK